VRKTSKASSTQPVNAYFCCLSSSLLYCVENIEKFHFKSRFTITSKDLIIAYNIYIYNNLEETHCLANDLMISYLFAVKIIFNSKNI
jgi:hypothetical protein